MDFNAGTLELIKLYAIALKFNATTVFSSLATFITDASVSVFVELRLLSFLFSSLEHWNIGTLEHWNTGTLELSDCHFPYCPD